MVGAHGVGVGQNVGKRRGCRRCRGCVFYHSAVGAEKHGIAQRMAIDGVDAIGGEGRVGAVKRFENLIAAWRHKKHTRAFSGYPLAVGMVNSYRIYQFRLKEIVGTVGAVAPGAP